MLTLLLWAGARHAAAQGYSLYTGNTVRSGTLGKNIDKYFGSVNVFPAVFDVGGSFNGGSNGTASLFGGLLDLELGSIDRALNKKTKKIELKGIYSIGGWYWGRSGNDFYEVHGRYQTPSGLGVQIGYLNTVQGFIARPSTINGKSVSVDAESYDIFLLYNFSSDSLHLNTQKRINPQTRELEDVLRQHYHNWAIEVGGGVFFDASKHQVSNGVFSNNTTGNYTFYVSGGYELTPRVWLQASDWVLRDRAQDLNRVSLGLAYKF